MELLLLTILIVATFFVYLSLRTQAIRNDPRQVLFSAGKLPDPLPNGFLPGTAPSFYKGSWAGKEFNAADKTGINIFMRVGKPHREYPFHIESGRGLLDPELNVLKIEYDLPENPFFLRAVLDEIVETTPGTYLGKVHVRWLPGRPFTLAYFGLRREEQAAKKRGTI